MRLGFGLINGCLPLSWPSQGAVFHGGGLPPPGVRANPSCDTGPKINDIILTCLWIPAVWPRAALSLRQFLLHERVSNRVVTDIRDQLFGKMVRHR